MSFISFSFLVALLGSVSAVLNKSGENVHPCLIPDLKGKAFMFLSLSLMLTVTCYICPIFPLYCGGTVILYTGG